MPERKRFFSIEPFPIVFLAWVSILSLCLSVKIRKFVRIIGLLLNDGLCVKAICWDCTSVYFNLQWPHVVCLLNLSSNFNEMFVQVFGRIRYAGHHRLAWGTSHWRLLELDKETKCGLQRWDLIISKLNLQQLFKSPSLTRGHRMWSLSTSHADRNQFGEIARRQQFQVLLLRPLPETGSAGASLPSGKL